MPEPSQTNAAARPVLYAGRLADEVTAGGPPESFAVLDDWEVLPAHLAATVQGAPALVILDPLSFPFESLTGPLRDVPLVVVVPEGLDPDFLSAVFGEPVFSRLGPFDRLAATDAATLDTLAGRHGLSPGQLVQLDGPEPAGELADVLEAEGNVSAVNKATHRAQRAVLRPQLEAARGGRADDVPFRVLEVGSGWGRWSASFDPVRTEFFGMEADRGAVKRASEAFPEATFDHLSEDLVLPHDDETFDLVFSVGLVNHLPDAEKRFLISEMWRVARPGGRLVFLEDFVPAPGRAETPAPVRRFVAALLQATGWQVSLEHMESVRYPGENLTRGGVLAVSRLGVPKRW